MFSLVPMKYWRTQILSAQGLTLLALSCSSAAVLPAPQMPSLFWFSGTLRMLFPWPWPPHAVQLLLPWGEPPLTYLCSPRISDNSRYLWFIHLTVWVALLWAQPSSRRADSEIQNKTRQGLRTTWQLAEGVSTLTALHLINGLTIYIIPVVSHS